MTRSALRRQVSWAAATLCAVLLLNPVAAAKKLGGDTSSGDGAIPDAVAGPIVRAVVDRLKDANTTNAIDKKKTIAQLIDEALEQEFPEEKEEKIGKNFNETAKNSDVSGSLSLHVTKSIMQEFAKCLLPCKRPQDMANHAGNCRDSAEGQPKAAKRRG